MESIVNLVNEKLIQKNDFPSFSAGDTITVYYEIREGDKVRTQFFKGVVIQIKGRGHSKTFTIRKMSGTIGVERVFPINMPGLKKIEVNKSGKVRQSRIYYFRQLTGKKASFASKETIVEAFKKDKLEKNNYNDNTNLKYKMSKNNILNFLKRTQLKLEFA